MSTLNDNFVNYHYARDCVISTNVVALVPGATGGEAEGSASGHSDVSSIRDLFSSNKCTFLYFNTVQHEFIGRKFRMWAQKIGADLSA